MVKEIKLLVLAKDSGVRKLIKKALKESFLDTKVDYVSKLSEASILSKKNHWNVVLTDFNLQDNSSDETIGFFKLQISSPVIVIADVHNEKALSKMSKASKAIGKPNATTKIVDQILKKDR